MSDTSLWITATVPVTAVIATTLINNRFLTRGRESQQSHDERLRRIDHVNAQKRALTDLKLTAYSAVLSEVGLAHQKKEEHFANLLKEGTRSGTFYNGDLTDAASRAKLLLDLDKQDAFESILGALYVSHMEASGQARQELVILFSEDLAIEKD